MTSHLHIRSTSSGTPAFFAKTFCGVTPSTDDVRREDAAQYRDDELCGDCAAKARTRRCGYELDPCPASVRLLPRELRCHGARDRVDCEAPMKTHPESYPEWRRRQKTLRNNVFLMLFWGFTLGFTARGVLAKVWPATACAEVRR
jgi:hypothetical protein